MEIAPSSTEAVLNTARTVVILGAFTHEGLSAKLQGLGLNVVRKQLWSSAKNWQKFTQLIAELRANGQLAAVIVYAPTPTLLHLSEERFDHVRDALLHELKAAGACIFLHEDSLLAKIEPAPWEIASFTDAELAELDLPWDDSPTDDGDDVDISARTFQARLKQDRAEWFEANAARITRALTVIATLQKRRIAIAPFRTRSDVTIRIFEILEDAEAGIFLKIYVPHGRYQSEQFEDFLTMFSRYLREVERREFSVSNERTARGTTYIFKGRGEVQNLAGLDNAIKRFDSFLALAETDPQAAQAMLETKGTRGPDTPFIISKYVRLQRRLSLDIRQEHDRRKLVLSQQLESELLEAEEAALIPVPPLTAPSALISIVGNSGTINFHQIHTQTSDSLRQQVWGDIAYSLEDRTLLTYINELEDKVEALRLRSDLDRLTDRATQPEERRTAVQRLKDLVYSAGKSIVTKAGEVGVETLIKYLENKIVGGP